MIISPDIENERLNDGIYKFTFDHHTTATRAAYYKFFQELNSGKYDTVYVMMGLPGSGKTTWARQHDDEKTLIWDATNLDRWKRIPLLSAIAAADYEVNLVYAKADYGTCAQRQDARPVNRAVPRTTIHNMMQRMFEPKKDLEGLHSLTIVEP